MTADVFRTAVCAALTLLGLLQGCDANRNAAIEGRPGGPYRLALTIEPQQPIAGTDTELTFQLTHARSGKPVSDLQIAHERLFHNFITDDRLKTFAHIHHEDFASLTEADRENSRVRFRYQFPHAGDYRIVSEFVHRDRSWIKHFDVRVEGAPAAADAANTDAMIATSGEFVARLSVLPATPVAGSETDLELMLERNNKPVDNLALYLGTELHGAVWREDRQFFGHLHSFTPKVAAIMELAHDRNVPAAERGARISQMMTQLMCLDAELVFSGPRIPMRYVFPEPGRYHLFLQVAPGGEPRSFKFVVDVVGHEAAAS